MSLFQLSAAAAVAVFSALSLEVGEAQSKVNFSGTWKMNLAKSDVRAAGLTFRLDKITHDDPNLKDVVISRNGSVRIIDILKTHLWSRRSRWRRRKWRTRPLGPKQRFHSNQEDLQPIRKKD